MIKSLKSGFTLAEVLTTLMVIGVVAAMTIPTLLNSTDEQQAKVAYRKAISVLSQGIQLLQAREDECYTDGGFTDNADLAACMAKVLNGNVNGDEITTADGMTFKFFVPTGTPATNMTLSDTCKDDFNKSTPGWQGGGNCGVIVDTNGRGKGTKSFPADVTFATGGFSKETATKDQLQLSLCSKGVRPTYFGSGKNKGYEYMYGRDSSNNIASPIDAAAKCWAKCDTATGQIDYSYAETSPTGYSACSSVTSCDKAS